MNCMKCGREIQNGIFCPECLAEMEKYPIKPGTVVHIPKTRPQSSSKKMHQRRKPQLTLEEQVKRLRRLVLRLLIALFAALLLLGFTGYYTVTHLLEEQTAFLPGQNYSAIGSDTVDEWD